MMNLLQSKTKEVAQSIVPIVIFVGILSMAFVRVDFPIVQRFFIASILVFVGLAIFLWGIDQAMEPIGYQMAHEIATSKGLTKVIVLSFILGYLVTIAEPDILILANQVESASGGSLNANFLVQMISIGVGLMIALGAVRILSGFKYNMMMFAVYAIIFVLGMKVSEEFLAISVDASGATTGALTTPFVLAISVGLSKIKGGKSSEEDSFGMVGAMSAGPIIAVMLISIISGQSHIHGEAEVFTTSNQVLAPFLTGFKEDFLESITALLPITVLFFVYNFVKFKIKRNEIIGIVRGLVYTLIGLTLFLVGANTGFMDMGRVLGTNLANEYLNILPFIGLILGMLVVLAEPAVLVLGQQVEDVTEGNIKNSTLRMTLSIGVGLAVALSMIKIMVPSVRLWFFLLPGFAIAIALSFFVDPIFVGIAFDAGGVASGPMSATFVMAFAQGVADSIPTADVLKDGFGIIAMIAMTPVLSIMILGTINKIQVLRTSSVEATDTEHSELLQLCTADREPDMDLHELIYCVINRGYSDEVIDLARSVGAGGATILRGRDARSGTWLSASLDMEKEKEIIWLIVDSDLTKKVVRTLLDASEKQDSHILSIFALPITRVDGIPTNNLELTEPLMKEKEIEA